MKSVLEGNLKELERMMCERDKIHHSPSVNNFVCRRIRYLVKAVQGRSIWDYAYLQYSVQVVSCVTSESQVAKSHG